MSHEFDVDQSMDGRTLSCYAFVADVPPLRDIRRRDLGNVASIKLAVKTGSNRGSSRNRGTSSSSSSSSGRGDLLKP